MEAEGRDPAGARCASTRARRRSRDARMFGLRTPNGGPCKAHRRAPYIHASSKPLLSRRTDTGVRIRSSVLLFFCSSVLLFFCSSVFSCVCSFTEIRISGPGTALGPARPSSRCPHGQHALAVGAGCMVFDRARATAAPDFFFGNGTAPGAASAGGHGWEVVCRMRRLAPHPCLTFAYLMRPILQLRHPLPFPRSRPVLRCT